MLYLLNATVIWLVSLTAFELFFKRETVHRLNRVYLLATLALGFLLPLFHWQQNGYIASSVVRTPVVQSAAIKESVLQTALAPTAPMHTTNWLLLAYLLGVTISLAFAAHAVVTYIKLYRGGSKTAEPGYLLIETGKAHSPFSFFHLIFISGTDAYSSNELRLLLRHELRHVRLLHSVDVLLLHAIKTIVWFHPLIYWYHRHLRMVHEYQADAAGKENITVYGQFLIEQALLQQAPAFTHSFHHSPIKIRIMMLMRSETTRARMAKYMLALPMIAFLSIVCTRDVWAQTAIKRGNKIFFHGNILEVNTAPTDLAKTDSANRPFLRDLFKENPSHKIDSFPVTLNGEKIYEAEELTVQPHYDGNLNSDGIFMLSSIANELAPLPDGDYVILVGGDAVLDKNGKLAYYSIEGIAPYHLEAADKDKETGRPIADVIYISDVSGQYESLWHQPIPQANLEAVINARDKIQAAIINTFNTELLHYTPAQYQGKSVATYLYNDLQPLFGHIIEVKQHKARVIPSEPLQWLRFHHPKV